MTPDQKHQFLSSITYPTYDEWTFFDRFLFQSCCDCGLVHMLQFRRKGGFDEVRFTREEDHTTWVREEQERFDMPLYKEVLQLREENAQLRHKLTTLGVKDE